MGQGQKFMTRAGSIFCCLGWVRLGQPSLIWVWKFSLKLVAVLFTVGQKYAQVGSGPISSKKLCELIDVCLTTYLLTVSSGTS